MLGRTSVDTAVAAANGDISGISTAEVTAASSTTTVAETNTSVDTAVAAANGGVSGISTATADVPAASSTPIETIDMDGPWEDALSLSEVLCLVRKKEQEKKEQEKKESANTEVVAYRYGIQYFTYQPTTPTEKLRPSWSRPVRTKTTKRQRFHREVHSDGELSFESATSNPASSFNSDSPS